MPSGNAEHYLRKGHGGETTLAKAELPHQGAGNRAGSRSEYWDTHSGLPKVGKGRYFVTAPLCNLYFSSYLLYLPRS